jgi:RimJ/RimL family protein N-acetyltransferase
MVLMFNSENLLLRPIRDTDIEHVFRGLSNSEVIRYYGVSFSSLEETKLQFGHEETLKECECKNGKWIDLDVYARLNGENMRP